MSQGRIPRVEESSLFRKTYVACGTDVLVAQAIAREKQVKKWSHRKKLDLIDAANPTWRDLSLDWDDPRDLFKPEKRPDSSTRGAKRAARSLGMTP